jgi:hypothetical protein
LGGPRSRWDGGGGQEGRRREGEMEEEDMRQALPEAPVRGFAVDFAGRDHLSEGCWADMKKVSK